MLSLQTIQPDTLELLNAIVTLPQTKEMRLVGGTALALQYGHRQSIDLDFFGSFVGDKEELIDSLKQIGRLSVNNQTNKIFQTTINNVKVDFVDYSRYNWIDSPVIENNIVLASPQDIAAMKVNAAIGRGTKKDFVDIYVLLQHYSLSQIFDFYRLKYPEYSDYRALLSLSYFEDAEEQDMPRLFINTTWEEMKQTIITAINEYQK